MSKKIKILFLCTGNSCRSQMAEGLCRHFKRDSIDAHSAGIETHGLNQSALRVMSEIGIDISSHHSKTAEELHNINFDFVVTVCSHAHETCPDFHSETKVIHHQFDDPPRLATDASTEEEALNHYRRVRDEIKSYIQTLPEAFITKLSGET